VLVQVDSVGSGGLELALRMLREHAARTNVAETTVLVVNGVPGGSDATALGEGDMIDLGATADREDAYRRFLQDAELDVVNAVYSTFGCKVAAELGIPFVQTIQNTYVWLDARERARWRGADLHTAAYVCVSDRAAYYSWKRLGLDPRKMLVVPNPRRSPRGEDDRTSARRRLGLPPDRFTFLDVATIHRPKAQLVLVEALGQLVGAGTDAGLALVGPVADPTYARLLERRASHLGITDRVVIAGPGPTESIDTWYAAADALAVPSFWEGWSLAVNEAVGWRLPLVLSRVGAAEEVAATAGATLVAPPFGEVDSLDVTSIQALLERVDAEYVRRWAEAMAATITDPRPSRPERLEPLVDPEQVFGTYLDILAWTAQGGPAAAARPWTFAPWRRAGGAVGRAVARSILPEDGDLR
jgi:glycosyltransferase involved in cell wall biosynthesis